MRGHVELLNDEKHLQTKGEDTMDEIPEVA